MIRRRVWTMGVAVATALVISTTASAVIMEVNIARLGTAEQTTTAFGGDAGRANDGGLGPSYGTDKTTSHTDNFAFNAWQVTSPVAPVEITSIELFNRGDCCGARLSDFDVSVLQDGSPVFLETVAGPVAQNGSHVVTPPAGVFGNGVRVQFSIIAPGTGLNDEGNGYLSLREVVVKGLVDVPNSTNLSGAFGLATQSSTRSGSGGNAAQFAIDNNTNGSFGGGSVTHTNDAANSFWEVDLTSTFVVDNLRLFNRTDCCTNRLSNFDVIFYDEDHNEVERIVNDGGPGSGYFAAPFGTEARFVRVQFEGLNVNNIDGVNNDGNGVLSLAEVQVFGGGLPNIARNPDAVASQSSTRVGTGGNVASVAIDGITDGAFFGSDSVTHTLTEDDPFWSLDFGGAFNVDEIVLWNRTDGCCTDRLSGAEVRLLDGGGAEVFLSVLGDTDGQASFRLDVDDVLAQSLRIDLPGAGRILSLAEVQVFGTPGIPEPGTALLGLLGLAGLARASRRRQRGA